MNVSEILRNVWFVSFLSKEDLSLSFLRFQEHYESPQFRDQIFSLEEFKSWYTAQNGQFSYVEDWSGFNVPSYVFKPFVDGKFDPLSPRETALLEVFKHKAQPFYVIATNDVSETLEHEICHALFYVDPGYREAVVALIDSRRDELSEVFAKMRDLGYHEAVFTDEVHAYLSANPDWLDSKGIKFNRDIPKQLQALKAEAMLRNKP